jgi:hypothetical protein
MPYEKQKMELPEGFIDLGEGSKSSSGMLDIVMASNDGGYHYPSLYFSNAEGLKGMPKEGTAMIKYKKVMEKTEETTLNGKTEKRHCVELCICGIKPEQSEDVSEPGEDTEDAIEKGLEEAESENEEAEDEEEEEED